MYIKLPLIDVDKLTDLALGKKANIHYLRKESNNPPKIIYTVTFKEITSPSWVIQLHPMTGGAEITFPIYIPSFDFFRANHLKPGAVLKILENEKVPTFDDPSDMAKFEICLSILEKLKLFEKDVQNQKKDESILPTQEIAQEEVHTREEDRKKPNAQINQRAMIWRELKGWIKLGNINPTANECLSELKKKPAYRNKKISSKRMQRILSEGFSGKYDEILKNI
jgi:hypothetical protein